MSRLGIIAGTGFYQMPGLVVGKQQRVETPYGEPSSPVVLGSLEGQPVVFLTRHGLQHQIPPHRVNYRANVWALQASGATEIIAIAAVGGISAAYAPGRLALPDQLIDYTWGREHTFFNEDFQPDQHIEFAQPYDAKLRERLLQAGREAGVELIDQGTYGATQGPRLETEAEIRRMARDGCDVVGMTGMPETSLARELGLPYASCCIVANWAAGVTDQVVQMADIQQCLSAASARVQDLLRQVVRG